MQVISGVQSFTANKQILLLS